MFDLKSMTINPSPTRTLLITVSIILWSNSIFPVISAYIPVFRGKCTITNPCQQRCVNLNRREYRCECWPGHKLAPNGFLCMEEEASKIVPNLIKSQIGGVQSSSRSSEESGNRINHIHSLHPLEDEFYQTCQKLNCLEGSTCHSDYREGGAKCFCPLGQEGVRCEREILIKYPRFSGSSSYEMFPVLNNVHETFHITLSFKAEDLDGLLLSNSEFENNKGDFFSLALVGGHIEFRFECGTGQSVITSPYNLTFGIWHTVVAYRHQWNGWLSVNQEEPVYGRSPGLYSRISVRQPLYLGGHPNISQGFKGCAQRLIINDQHYDFREGPFGMAVGGANVDECSRHVCENITCENGGHCEASSADTFICLCPLGTAGAMCEQIISFHLPSFLGSSYLSYEGFSNRMLSFFEIELIFRAHRPSGLLLYQGLRTNGTGDFLSITLANGHVEFRFDCGTGPAIIRSHNEVELNEWHTVFVSRTGRDGYMQVNHQAQVEAMSEGAFTQTSFTTDLYLGGHPNFDELAKNAKVHYNFVGDVQKLVINNVEVSLAKDALEGINVINADHPCGGEPCGLHGNCIPQLDVFLCDCRLGYVGDNCQQELEVPDARGYSVQFEGRTYLRYTSPDILSRLSGDKTTLLLKLQTSSTSEDGLILWTGQEVMKTSSDYLALGLEEGHLKLSYNLGSGEVQILSNLSLTTGHWHDVSVVRKGQKAVFKVDGVEVIGQSPGKLRQLNTNNGLYLGGTNEISESTLHRYDTGFVGCVRSIILATDYHIELLNEPADGLNVNICTS